MKISLAIPTFNRFELTIKSFEKVIDDDRISEILISDDASTDGSYESLKRYFARNEKVWVRRANINKGMAFNKYICVEESSEEWVCLFDSDNVIDKDYIDAFFENVQKPRTDTIYQPIAALPNFVFTNAPNNIVSRETLHQFKGYRNFMPLMNNCNYIVNREFYLLAFEHNPEIKGVDTAWHFYNHLLMGGRMEIVKGMSYQHLVHGGSEFLKHVHENMAASAKLERKIFDLCL